MERNVYSERFLKPRVIICVKNRCYLWFILPDNCPVCLKSVLPDYILSHYENDGTEKLLCYCPNNEYGLLFFAVNTKNPFDEGKDYILNYLYPHGRNSINFPEEIIGLSPNFIEIYNQAYHADL